VIVVVGFLVLLDTDVPLTLDALLLAVGMALVRIYLVHAESEHGEREELEGVFGAGAVVDFGENGILGACFFVGVGVEGANGTLDCSKNRQLL